MRTLKLTEETQSELLGNLLNRNPGSYTEYENTVNEIIDNVRKNGDKAVFEYTLKFDKSELSASTVRVTEDEIKAAYKELDPKFVEVMKRVPRTFVYSTRSRREIPGSIQKKTEASSDRESFPSRSQVYMSLVERLHILQAFL